MPFKISILAILLLATVPALGSPVALTSDFSRSEGGNYLRFELRNPFPSDVSCRQILVKAEIGEERCEKILSLYTYKDKDLRLPAGSAITNANFGIDFLHAESRRLKVKLVFCGQPILKQQCSDDKE